MTATLGGLAKPEFLAERLCVAGMPAEAAQGKGMLFARVAGHLLDRGVSADTMGVAAFVPGRIEVFGKHTDYCGGRSLLCTVERGLCFVATPRKDTEVHLHALDMGATAVFSLVGEGRAESGYWSNYPGSVVRRIARNFPGAVIGADIAIAGDLPRASGMSSSSAIIVGTFMVLAELNCLSDHPAYRRNLPTKEALAGYLGTIENGQSFGEFAGDLGVGTFGGSQDHTAILCCKPGRLSLYSFCPVQHHVDIPLPAGLKFVIGDSGVVAEKTGSARESYNRVSLRVREIVRLWNEADTPFGRAAVLNDIVVAGPEAVARLGEILSRQAGPIAADLTARLDQFLVESHTLIPRAATALAAGDLEALRALVERSQLLAELNLRNQVPETIAVQREMIRCGAVAASAFGAGFGGSVWGLFPEGGLARWAEAHPSGSWFASGAGIPATLLTDRSV